MRKKNTDTDTYSYRGWLVSDKFLKRSFAIYGYSLVPAFFMMFATLLVFMTYVFYAWLLLYGTALLSY